MDNYPDEIFKIKEFLKKDPRGMNIQQISDGLQINRNSVSKYLDILTAQEEVAVRMFGRSKVYYLSQHVPISELMKFSSNFIIILNQDLRIVQLNDAFLRYVNLPKENLLGSKMTDTGSELFCSPEFFSLVHEAVNGKETNKEIQVNTSSPDLFYKVTLTPTIFQDQSRGVIVVFENITERKQVELALIESEEKYRTLTENTRDILYSLDTDGVITYISPQVTRFGLMPEEFINKKFDLFIFPKDRDQFSQNILRNVSSGGGCAQLFRICDKKGGVLWMESSSMAKRNASGTVTGIIGILRDVTERKHAEDALKQSERQLADIIDHLPDATLAIDRNGNIIAWNKAIEEMTGVKAEEMLGKGNYEYAIPFYGYRRPILIDLIFDSDKVADKEYYHIIKREGGLIIAETDLKRPKGKIATVWAKATPFYDEFGNKIGAIESIRDVTDRKRVEEALRESEARLNAIVYGTPTPQFVIDRDHKVVYWNKALEVYSGIRADEMIGTDQHWKAFYDQKRPCMADLMVDGAIEHVSQWYEGKYTKSKFIDGAYEAIDFIKIMGKEGSWMYFTAAAVRDINGDIIGAVETLEDINDIKQVEEELQTKQREMAAVLKGLHGVVVEYLDPSLKIIWANEEMAKEFCTSPEEVRGKYCYNVIRNRKEPCPDCTLSKCIPSGSVREGAVTLPDGRVFLERCNPVINNQGSVAGVVHTMINITRLKLAEKELKFKNLILLTQQETSLDGILVLDMEGKVISSNQHLVDICGISPDVVASQSGERMLKSVSDMSVDPLEFLCRVEHLNANKDERSHEEISLNDGRRIDRYSAPMLGAGDEYLGRVWYFRDVTERRQAEDALKQTTRKLSLFNSIAFTDIQNAIFSLSGYFELEKQIVTDKKQQQYLDKEIAIIRTVTESLKFVNNYQNLGLKPPAWQNVEQSFLFGISHLDLSRLSRKLDIEGLEIYADPLLENVFFTLAENVVLHGETATEISLWYHETPKGLMLVFEDNGIGIPDDLKEKIFDRRYEEKRGMGLFLAREILSITGILMKETGEYEKGAKFEMLVPKSSYRFIA
ncbi:MAG: PAS domain S-box protein [Methanoregula sp.]|nr:PAS domain S-box protein [Methanoregula sp.]